MRRTSARVARRSGPHGNFPFADEAVRARVADEQRRDDQVQLVRQVTGQELRVHAAAALDHEPPDPTGVQVLAEPAQVHRRAAVHHGRDVPQGARAPRKRLGGAVDELLALPRARKKARLGSSRAPRSRSP